MKYTIILICFICSAPILAMEQAHKKRKIIHNSNLSIQNQQPLKPNPFAQLPKQLFEEIIFSCSPTEESFEDLQQILKIMRIDKFFYLKAKRIYYERLSKQQQKIANEYDYKKKWTAIETGLLYWLHDNLKTDPVRKANCNASAHKIPLAFAVSYNQVNSVKLLLKAGADINNTNYLSETTLHLALSYKSYKCAKFLINKGANLLIANNKKTPLEYAESLDHRDEHDIVEINEIIALIKQKVT